MAFLPYFPWRCKCHQIVSSLSPSSELQICIYSFLTDLVVYFKCKRFRKKLDFPMPKPHPPPRFSSQLFRFKVLNQLWSLPFPQPLNLVCQKFLFLPTNISWIKLLFTFFTASSSIQTSPIFSPGLAQYSNDSSAFYFCSPIILSLQSS